MIYKTIESNIAIFWGESTFYIFYISLIIHSFIHI